MTLISALEDLKLRTLACLPGTLARFLYLAGLCDGDRYEHWGLQKSYGEASASEALASAHAEAFVEVLRTPLRELAEKADAATAGAMEDAALPANAGRAAEAHFSSTVAALAALAARGRAGTGRAA